MFSRVYVRPGITGPGITGPGVTVKVNNVTSEYGKWESSKVIYELVHGNRPVQASRYTLSHGSAA